MAQSEFLIDGMTCEHCERAIRDALVPLDGVSNLQVSAATGIATVQHDDRLVMSDVTAAVADAGYSVRM